MPRNEPENDRLKLRVQIMADTTRAIVAAFERNVPASRDILGLIRPLTQEGIIEQHLISTITVKGYRSGASGIQVLVAFEIDWERYEINWRKAEDGEFILLREFEEWEAERKPRYPQSKETIVAVRLDPRFDAFLEFLEGFLTRPKTRVDRCSLKTSWQKGLSENRESCEAIWDRYGLIDETDDDRDEMESFLKSNKYRVKMNPPRLPEYHVRFFPGKERSEATQRHGRWWWWWWPWG